MGMSMFEMTRNAAREDTMKFHMGQKRKWSNEPYHNHPIRVAEAILNSKWGEYEDLVIAAYGHDWLEDCETSHDYIIDSYGVGVYNIIFDVTNVYTKEAYPHLNRQLRISFCEHQRLGYISRFAKVLKMFDRLDNLDGLDKGFAPTYLKESHSLLNSVKDADGVLAAKLYKRICELEVKFGL